ncbi:SRPBCC family protein [Fluviicola chungangensis]|uniref:SRPBCC domain-containing protein n=1 Tax=Fluviicola chungangensis TaxID=2597671 RepID=A0A556MQV3_9FLAO|nr:SRPBCC domain-containing protein [Fluviicola chungangensis]TSJ42334.1 SRPBCC domain-containing protein [Fluviicola chungangensis]
MPHYELPGYPNHIEKSILIEASLETVWSYLTDPKRMKEWMGDEAMEIDIISDWKIGGSFVIRGFHHVPFENRGTILQFDPEKVFQYEFLSSLSNLEDLPENYTTISFCLKAKGDQTELRVEASNFPTFEIYKHWEFYWNGTLEIIKCKSVI